MRLISCAFAAALLATSAASMPADLVLTQKKHIEAYTSGTKEIPAKELTTVIWAGKDRMRFEDGDKITIIRQDTKKMIMLDAKARTATTVDLPFDLKKYLMPEGGDLLDKLPKPKCTVTPSEETKKIKDWNTKKFTVEITPAASPMAPPSQAGKPGTVLEIWVTKDLEVDAAALRHMWSTTMFSMVLGGSAIADEMKKIDGFPVAIDKTERRGQVDVKSHEELVSVEKKDAPEGAYDVPKDYKDRPFDPVSDVHTGLGMAIAKSVITAHKGRISVASVQGSGTTVAIRLPGPSPVVSR